MDNLEENIRIPTEKKIESHLPIRFILILIGVGVLSILIYSSRCLFWYWYNDPLINAISSFSLCILIAGATLTGGCLIGFIFAIPKSLSNSDSNMIRTSVGYVANDNLVQVSDWLTKIIVGVGLTQLTQFPYYFRKVGEYFGPAAGGTNWGEIAAVSIVIYFSICGFLLAYIWTRIYFSKMLE